MMTNLEVFIGVNSALQKTIVVKTGWCSRIKKEAVSLVAILESSACWKLLKQP